MFDVIRRLVFKGRLVVQSASSLFILCNGVIKMFVHRVVDALRRRSDRHFGHVGPKRESVSLLLSTSHLKHIATFTLRCLVQRLTVLVQMYSAKDEGES